MSFTMSQVKRKPSSKQQDIKSCYRLIYSDTILTDNAKPCLALSVNIVSLYINL